MLEKVIKQKTPYIVDGVPGTFNTGIFNEWSTQHGLTIVGLSCQMDSNTV